MKILNADWTPRVNLLLILCDCGRTLTHRADRVTIHCNDCGMYKDLHDLRAEELRANVK